MTVAKYDLMLSQIKQAHGAIDILVVDGLSMMGGQGDELEKANRHTLELKELAKKYNIFVFCIVHASRGESLETRDLSKKARGSEKIVDNCDFTITMSLIKINKKDHSSLYGVYNCWNKRGSGNRIEKVFKFTERRLKMIEVEKASNKLKGCLT